ncbi:hypothetical protein B0T18DRAFT_185007 [Schizothecium vesticola]|uniref:Mid2 domain-containing protein n=1 Tax=Schizothecium vesticola TaxID=314040 RepID=A0AA40EQ70_9PEZI|nr:hypothetical protein B0T18DRAFT_185007 [Schizothecium vesticola]
MAASPSGFALRLNGSSCLRQEVDCGGTVGPYRVCCPEGAFCPSQYNVDCCPSASNCTTTLIENPRCANETWDLYDNGGYFCCLRGLFGYAARVTNSNGCGSEGYILKSGEVRLPLIQAGTAPSTVSLLTSSTLSTSATTPVSPSSTSSTSFTTKESDNSLSTGGKIGIGIGVPLGVIAFILVIWLVFRHGKKKSAGTQQPEMVSGLEDSRQDAKVAPYRQELEGNQAPAEMGGYHEYRPPVELDGQHR